MSDLAVAWPGAVGRGRPAGRVAETFGMESITVGLMGGKELKRDRTPIHRAETPPIGICAGYVIGGIQ
jgi:hypothetical protein